MLGLALAAACGQTTTQTGTPGLEQTNCSARVAQLAVRDGFIQNLCGCVEPIVEPTPASPTTLVTCTVTAGTTVFFHYIATTLTHAIVSTGSPSFVSSPLSDPVAQTPYRIHGVLFDKAGTYRFEDAFNEGLQGRIVVQ